MLERIKEKRVFYILPGVLGYLFYLAVILSLERFNYFFTGIKTYRSLFTIIFSPFISPLYFFLFIFLETVFVSVGIFYIGRFKREDLFNEEKPFSARRMKEDELRRDESLEVGKINEISGILLGKDGKDYVSRREVIGENNNFFLTGMAGTGKSTGFIIPAIYRLIEMGHSLVTIDTKGALFSATLNYARFFGYRVRVFNCQNPLESDGWNILASTSENPREISRITDQIYDCLKSVTGKAREPFWDNSATTLFKALIAYVIEEEKEIPKGLGIVKDLNTLGRVYDILTNYRTGEMAIDHLIKLFQDLERRNSKSIALGFWKDFSSASKPDILNSIIQELAITIECFKDPGIRRLLGESRIDFTELGKEKTIYYINLSEQVGSETGIASLFIREICYRLTDFADRAVEKRLPVPVDLVLDEFGAIGRIPNFDRFISGSRGRGISCILAVQNISQLYPYYGDGVDTITANCATWINMGIHDLKTASAYSAMIGDSLYKLKSSSVNKNKDAVVTSVSESDALFKQKYLEEAELVNMDSDKVLVYAAGKNPLILDKLRCWEMEAYSLGERADIYQYRERYKKEKPDVS